LQYLTNRLDIISLQDTLQYIALQPEANRAGLIDVLASPVVLAEASPGNTGSSFNFPGNYNTSPANRAQPQNSFYFSNATAISIGFNDFKKKWGSRKLENNWRQSVRSSAQESVQDTTGSAGTAPVNPDEAAPIVKDKETLIKQYTEALPVTADLLAQSNQKIINAYYEIASFYLQELLDAKEAEYTYLKLLKRFPANDHLAAIYYSLFLISKDVNESVSNEYKNKILKEFPESIYAKTILDPSFSVKQSELEIAINKKYDQIFDQYVKKEFPAVIQQVDENARTGQTLLSPQFAYLKAIAIGRTSYVDSLIIALDNIITQFPDDKLITPLVKEHLTYINEHIEDFKKRQIALIDFDPNEPPFMGRPAPVIASNENQAAPVQIPQKPQQKPEQKAPPLLATTKEPVKTVDPVKVSEPVKTPEPESTKIPEPVKVVDSPFSTAKSTVYYYVIDVADASLTLSSSRFGIGQFNRGNFTGSNLRHQLKEFDNDQLIYIGNFSNFEDAKAYSNGISPQLKQIMKVPVNVYTSFIISKENFDKLTSKNLLDKYIEFYKNQY
ncbi:MAG TPA: hypothetical protein VKB19_10210, partial [Pedobacter sp.]|nr:hypothetical protein [Pedobacter sp.]